jgi:hypothetical protein
VDLEWSKGFFPYSSPNPIATHVASIKNCHLKCKQKINKRFKYQRNEIYFFVHYFNSLIVGTQQYAKVVQYTSHHKISKLSFAILFMLNNLGSMLLCTTNDDHLDLDFFCMQPIYMSGGCLGSRYMVCKCNHICATL